MLRLGVFIRAGLTVAANAGRRLLPVLLDALLVWAVVAGLGWARSAQTGVGFSPLFYGMVAPVYALCTVAAIAMLEGYRPGRRDRVGPVWLGAGLGLLMVAALSFFAKDIAFSRLVVLLGFPAAAALLSAVRIGRRARRSGPRRAVFVGPACEAQRLHGMLSSHLAPPFQLVGYVTAGDDPAPHPNGALPRLGSLQQLRDLVRLRRFDDVVFAADGLSNRTIFRLMQHLRDLPVQARILAAGRDHVIGKASIADLSTPTLIEAETALGLPRSPAARRVFDVGAALLGLVLYPVVWAAGRIGGAGSVFGRLHARLEWLPDLLAGRRALVGYDPTGMFVPPPEWQLRPGVFTVEETLKAVAPGREELSQAYWFYVRNQSAFLDCTIVLRALGAVRT